MPQNALGLREAGPPGPFPKVVVGAQRGKLLSNGHVDELVQGYPFRCGHALGLLQKRGLKPKGDVVSPHFEPPRCPGRVMAASYSHTIAHRSGTPTLKKQFARLARYGLHALLVPASNHPGRYIPGHSYRLRKADSPAQRPRGRAVRRTRRRPAGFNGLRACWHPQNDELVIPYPSESAHGIGPNATAIDGDFHNVGVTLRHRCCNGCCSYETFLLSRSKTLPTNAAPDDHGLFGEYVKTAFRPYDLAVTAALLIAKRRLRDQFIVHSNGDDAQWADARQLCHRILGYGDWFGITEERIEEQRVRTLTEVLPPGG